MRLLVVAAGKVREASLRSAIDDYLGRARRHLPVDEVEIKSKGGRASGRSMLQAIPSRYEIWALEAGGKEPTSSDLARWLEARMSRGTQGVAFVLGAADGLPPEIRGRADLTMSLSRLTLPHRLARLVLAEQLYRAMTIIRNEPYSR